MVPLDFLVPRRGRCRLRPRASSPLEWMLDADDDDAVVLLEDLSRVVMTGTVPLRVGADMLLCFPSADVCFFNFFRDCYNGFLVAGVCYLDAREMVLGVIDRWVWW